MEVHSFNSQQHQVISQAYWADQVIRQADQAISHAGLLGIGQMPGVYFLTWYCHIKIKGHARAPSNTQSYIFLSMCMR